MPLAQAPLSAFAGGGSEADEGFLDSQSGRLRPCGASHGLRGPAMCGSR